jgi:hypothetical protein
MMGIVAILFGLMTWTLGVASEAHAERFTVTTTPFVIQCTSTGQLCEPPATLVVGDARRHKVRKIVYDAASAHCSAGRLLIELDGQPVGRMRFVAGSERATLRKRIRLQPGEHEFAFRFEGKLGGCNAGQVASWGGVISVQGRRKDGP